MAPKHLRLASAALSLGLALILSTAAVVPAAALSEIKREELPSPTTPASPESDGSDTAVPVPDVMEPAPAAEPAPAEAPAAPEQLDDADAATDEPVPEIIYDISRLPPEVQRTRAALIEATASGDIERLRPLLGSGDDATQISLAGVEGDPIQHLKSLAGDEAGQEILAILEEVLSAGYVHLDAGSAEELYVWPYFFAVPIDKLTGPQRVELFKIVTAGDYEDMKNYGSYIFYRVGITPQGRWAFFVAGE